MTTNRILALDISSTTIGWALLADAPEAAGSVRLPRLDVAGRAAAARAAVLRLVALHRPARLAIEGAAASRLPGSSVIAVQRVVGAVLALAWEERWLVTEVPPATAKKAAAGRGNADKATMIACVTAAWPALGALDEHAADAVAVGLVAAQERVEVVL